MSLEILKLNKQLTTAMTEAGFTEPKEIQERSLSRIIGGQDIVGIGPEGCGKTTTLILGVLMRLKYAQEEAPRALILVSSKEAGQKLEEQFALFTKHINIRVIGLYPGAGMEGQRDALAEGTDIAIGTPDRILAIYLKSGINMNKLKMFILEDAEMIVKQGQQSLVLELSDRIPKCQHLVFAEVYHTKLERLITPFLNYPAIIEVSEGPEEAADTIDLVLYNVPNYKTKLNLLNMLMRDYELYTKVFVFVNSKITQESLYKSLARRIEGEVAVLSPNGSFGLAFDSVEDFKTDPMARVLIIVNNTEATINFDGIPFLLHFDLPEDKDIFIGRVKKEENENREAQCITFSTDIELSLVKKIEQELGKTMQIEEPPLGLIIEGDRQSHKEKEKEDKSGPDKGAAFHEKKAKNSKDYNLKYKDRLKMFGKKNRKNKKGFE